MNGYPLPMAQRFAKIRNAGFDAILLWWGSDEKESREERVVLAQQYGLHVENVHAFTDGLNALWLEGGAGENVLGELEQEVRDCAACGVKTLVVHLTNGSTPPPVSALGMSRIERLVCLAQRENVRLAFENVRKPEHVQAILEQFRTSAVGLCYDSGHEHYWSRNVDWLKLYGERVFAIHLHDNFGDRDSHLNPFDGEIDWERKTRQLAESSYAGAITVESEMHTGSGCETESLEAFLDRSRESALRLERQIKMHRERLR